MANPTPLKLEIDIFPYKAELAEVLPTLTPPQLVAAILQEFTELEYLSDDPASYQLLRDSGTPLDDSQPLGTQQLSAGAHLALAEREPPLPASAARLPGDAYLRDLGGRQVFRLCWQPAIIGRPAQSLPHNDLLAVDLSAHITRLRVSRRHAQITAGGGQYFIQSLSSSPTLVERADGQVLAVPAQPLPLQHGDIICLERSDIRLQFIIRSDALPQVAPSGSGDPSASLPGPQPDVV